MTLKSTLMALARAVAEEAEKNAPFRRSLETLIEPKIKNREGISAKARARHRRAPAKLDPIELARQGQDIRQSLMQLDIEELKDVVAEFAMDPSKLVMKWKDSKKIIEHIVETSLTRASKGDAFRN